MYNTDAVTYYTKCNKCKRSEFMLDFFEIGATIFGLIQGFLVMINKRSNWIAYCIQMIFLVVFSIYSHLYGDVVNNLIYFILGIVGFLIWNRKDENEIQKCSNKERIIYSGGIAISTFLLYLVLSKTNDPLALLDAFTTTSSFVATYYMMTKKLDTWIIWFVNDIFYCIEYFLLPDQALYLLALNVIWTIMAVVSYINWSKIMKVQS